MGSLGFVNPSWRNEEVEDGVRTPICGGSDSSPEVHHSTASFSLGFEFPDLSAQPASGVWLQGSLRLCSQSLLTH